MATLSEKQSRPGLCNKAADETRSEAQMRITRFFWKFWHNMLQFWSFFEDLRTILFLWTLGVPWAYGAWQVPVTIMFCCFKHLSRWKTCIGSEGEHPSALPSDHLGWMVRRLMMHQIRENRDFPRISNPSHVATARTACSTNQRCILPACLCLGNFNSTALFWQCPCRVLLGLNVRLIHII